MSDSRQGNVGTAVPGRPAERSSAVMRHENVSLGLALPVPVRELAPGLSNDRRTSESSFARLDSRGRLSPGEHERGHLRYAGWVKLAAGLALSAVREIFDESAYARFLIRHSMSSCPDAYGAFLREQDAIKCRRPKCC